jgi:hypothetical protein
MCTDHEYNIDQEKITGFSLNIKVQNYKGNRLQHLQRMEGC